VFSNAFSTPLQEPTLVLASAPAPQWRNLRDARRALERLQTKTFVHEALKETKCSSVYALEQRMMKGLPDSADFPQDRPKLCDRMASLGEPAVAKQLGPGARRDLRTKKWFDRLAILAPKAGGVLSMQLWRLLNPLQMTFVEWHATGFALALEQYPVPGLNGVWMVSVTPSAGEDLLEHFVPRFELNSRSALAGLLTALRRWETHGDLIGYDLMLQEALRIASASDAQPDLKVLQPDIAGYIAQCFGSVHVAYHATNLGLQEERVAAGRAAWSSRIHIPKEGYLTP
jgi:hypothetical protein